MTYLTWANEEYLTVHCYKEGTFTIWSEDTGLDNDLPWIEYQLGTDPDLDKEVTNACELWQDKEQPVDQDILDELTSLDDNEEPMCDWDMLSDFDESEDEDDILNATTEQFMAAMANDDLQVWEAKHDPGCYCWVVGGHTTYKYRPNNNPEADSNAILAATGGQRRSNTQQPLVHTKSQHGTYVTCAPVNTQPVTEIQPYNASKSAFIEAIHNPSIVVKEDPTTTGLYFWMEEELWQYDPSWDNLTLSDFDFNLELD